MHLLKRFQQRKKHGSKEKFESDTRKSMNEVLNDDTKNL